MQEPAPLTFFIFFPGWFDTPAYEVLKASTFTKFIKHIPKRSHSYLAGHSHLPTRTNTHFAYADTLFFVCQNAAGASKNPGELLFCAICICCSSVRLSARGRRGCHPGTHGRRGSANANKMKRKKRLREEKSLLQTNRRGLSDLIPAVGGKETRRRDSGGV